MIDCAHVAWQTANNPTVNDHGNVIKATKHINLSVISAAFVMQRNSSDNPQGGALASHGGVRGRQHQS